uniref:Uncharacterized protein n=1 Tax=Rhizophora mucronata TaxID=61149 RepID=A0A2P2PYR0_RHIMU
MKTYSKIEARMKRTENSLTIQNSQNLWRKLHNKTPNLDKRISCN